MRGEHTLSRRTLLAAVGTTTIGSIVTTAAMAQDRDPEEFDRPRTVEENDIEITMWDCSRVIVNTERDDVFTIEVRVEYLFDYWREEIDQERARETLDIEAVEWPMDINVNERIPLEGAYAGADRVSNVIIDRVRVLNFNDEVLTEVVWPQEEWRCDEVLEMELAY